MRDYMDRQKEQYYNTKQCAGAEKNKIKCCI